MVEAYVLIQTAIGKARMVAEAASNLPGVASTAVVTGPYDIVARVTAPDVDALGKLTITRIQAVDGVMRTLTCPVLHI